MTKKTAAQTAASNHHRAARANTLAENAARRAEEAAAEEEAAAAEPTAWLIQYENDAYPALKVNGDREHAELTARRRNKYSETYTITAAPKEDNTLELERAEAAAKKYGNFAALEWMRQNR